MADCLFCRIVAGDVPSTEVRSTDRVYAFRDIAPHAPTHVLVVPREHHTDAVTLAASDPGLLAELVTVGEQVATDEGIADSGYRLVFNLGPDSGQTVLHTHLHVLGGTWLAGMAGGPMPG
ncbi:MAG TPA: histidine triad nucleotide-binding protein [Mycobacteriales bacterium]|jgi:Diadenosine tetraphosphate (Ap4A) hydrolase and other HIT family hydrolases